MKTNFEKLDDEVEQINKKNELSKEIEGIIQDQKYITTPNRKHVYSSFSKKSNLNEEKNESNEVSHASHNTNKNSINRSNS
jgi:hypothetical protein